MSHCPRRRTGPFELGAGVLTVLVALSAAVCFAFTSVLQHRAAGSVASTSVVDPGLLLRLAKRPVWLLSGVLDAAGFALQALALRLGQVSVVQPLLVSGFLLAVPLGAALDRARVARKDLLGVGLAGAALAVLLATANPHGGVDTLGVHAAVVAGVVCGVPTLGCLLLATRVAGDLRATLLGVATGILFGVTAILLKVCAAVATSPGELLTNWSTYALVTIGLSGFALSMHAFQAGALPAPLTAMTVFDPVVATALGLAVLHERISTGGVLAVAQIVCCAALLGAVAVIAAPGDATIPVGLPE